MLEESINCDSTSKVLRSITVVFINYLLYKFIILNIAILVPICLSIEMLGIVPFLFGTFVSSLGSWVFFIFLLINLASKSSSYGKISLIIGLPRLVATLALYLMGSKLDQLNTKKILLSAEITAAICALAIFHYWDLIDSNLSIFLVLLCIRSTCITIQSGLKSKVMRAYSGNEVKTNSKTAALLNQATQGSFAFAAALAFFLKNEVSFGFIIIFDFISFVIGGLSVLTTVNLSLPSHGANTKAKESLLREYFGFFRKIAYADVLLTVSVAGLSTLIYKIANYSGAKISLLNVIYGSTLILISQLGNTEAFRKRHRIKWGVLCLSLFGLAFNYTNPPLMYISFTFVLFCYWLLYNKYSALIQHKSPPDKLAGFVSARNIMIAVIAVAGEFATGQVSKIITLNEELLVRSLVALFGLIVFWSFEDEFSTI
jgi:hypothetical protein